MIRFLIHVVTGLISSVLGLLLAGWLVPGVTLQVSGFLTAVLVYTVVTAIAGPFVFNLARQFATPLLGGIGLVSTLIALLVATSFPGGITISGASAWVMAVFVVWITGALGGWILLWVLLKRRRAARDE